ncbi:MAG: TolC family protein [Saprospiraceae bacterium]|nr:TolC family protein [Saprospiraceae bacterium]MCF8251788.1 TolC family protein [Saprospiraceae bacterium]MCF8281274.1 TolC family protein [Bacteroidales bacterium]MCF8313430.1 TolC family protein [Saprospiraceae bacterium]MCF8442143.1 TolC family protein [Saprospiraceae bacterium]
MRKLTSILFALTIGVSPIFSQQILTLEEVVGAALAQNYSILLAKNEAAITALDATYVNWALAPRLNATLGTIWNNNDQRQEFSDGTVRERNNVASNNLNASVGLNWTLFDGMKMFVAKDKTLEIARTGELVVKEQVVNTVAEVRNIYYNIVRQKQQLKAIEEQMSVSEERVKVAERKLSTGLGSKPELLQAKVDLNAQKARQLQQRTLITQLKELLNQQAGMQLPLAFDVTDDIPFDTSLNFAEIERNIPSTNPSLLLAGRNIGIARLTLKEHEASRYPTLSFNSAYNLSRLDNQTVVNPFQPLISSSNGFNFGLTANIPILNNRLVHRNIEQSKLAINGLEIGLANQQTAISTSLRNAFRDYEYQMQALNLEEENIELAKENVAIALERFKQGVSTYLELREAQKSLEDAYDRLIAARYNAKVAETEVLRLKGDLVR